MNRPTLCLILGLILASVCATASLAATPNPFFEKKDDVHEIHLRFNQPDWFEKLTQDYGDGGGDNVPYTEASFEWRDVKMEKVGVRFKGFGSFMCTNGPKKPFRIKLNEFTKGQKIGGLGTYNLNNNCGDPSYVRERPYYELGASAGLLTPRHTYAALYINDKYWGLYTLVEVPNADWLVERLGATEKGNLYKGDPTGTFEDLGDDTLPYRQNYEKKTNESADDWSDLKELIAIVNRAPLDELPARVEKLLDVDSVLSALAVDAVTVNLDSYRGYGHNYFLYRRVSDGRFQFIPWDGNLSFGGFNFEHDSAGLQALPNDWTAENYRSDWKRPLASRLFAVPEYKARYERMIAEMLQKDADPFVLVTRMTELRNLIRPWVEKEAGVLYPIASFEAAMADDQLVISEDAERPAGMATWAPALTPLIEGRTNGLRLQLESKTAAAKPGSSTAP